MRVYPVTVVSYPLGVPMVPTGAVWYLDGATPDVGDWELYRNEAGVGVGGGKSTL
ncbi:MAG: hypothetical protein LBU17_01125 [Treponema sp.]|nr:hypothetical protein [Treponema sp.]